MVHKIQGGSVSLQFIVIWSQWAAARGSGVGVGGWAALMSQCPEYKRKSVQGISTPSSEEKLLSKNQLLRLLLFNLCII